MYVMRMYNYIIIEDIKLFQVTSINEIILFFRFTSQDLQPHLIHQNIQLIISFVNF